MFYLGRRSVFATGISSLLVAATRAAESEDNLGPFGLMFNSSADEVRRTGVQLAPVVGTEWGTSFVASGLEKVLSDMDNPILSFGFKDKLWRVAAAGKTNSADPYGSNTVARYKELMTSLSEKYGPGRETDARDREMWKDPSEYIMSLQQGRAARYALFSARFVTIELSVRASDASSSYYVIIYKSIHGEKEFAIDKKTNEKGSL